MTRHLLLSLLLLLGIASCDFPPEPPLKAPVVPGPIEPDIDAPKELLQLRDGNRWAYLVITDGGGPHQLSAVAVAREVRFQGESYFQLRYAYFGNPFNPVLAFPSLLQNTNAGLRFYDRNTSPQDTSTTLSRPPKFAFMLPYPSRAGTVHEFAPEHAVRVVAKDTLVRSYDELLSYRCYRYDVEFRNRTRWTLYVAPGKAIIRAELENLTYHTTGWRLE